MDGEEYDLSFKDDLQELDDGGEIMGLPRVRKLGDNEERPTREHVASEIG